MKWSAAGNLLLLLLLMVLAGVNGLQLMMRHDLHGARHVHAGRSGAHNGESTGSTVRRSAAVASDRYLRAAVIAPSDPDHRFSLKKILPAITLAARTIEENGRHGRGPLPGWKIHIVDRDSKCSSVYGPLEAFDLYNNKAIGDHSFNPFENT